MPIERIPPVRARFPCAKCGEPMDFPSREQAQIKAKLQREALKRETAEAELVKTAPIARGENLFRVDKRGWEEFFFRTLLKNIIDNLDAVHPAFLDQVHRVIWIPIIC